MCLTLIVKIRYKIHFITDQSVFLYYWHGFRVPSLACGVFHSVRTEASSLLRKVPTVMKINEINDLYGKWKKWPEQR